jgi:hypothetical protein
MSPRQHELIEQLMDEIGLDNDDVNDMADERELTIPWQELSVNDADVIIRKLTHWKMGSHE